ncbi:hypothetical protein D3C80_1682450 [compost metagenome]
MININIGKSFILSIQIQEIHHVRHLGVFNFTVVRFNNLHIIEISFNQITHKVHICKLEQVTQEQCNVIVASSGNFIDHTLGLSLLDT